jgi:hypothetical protein
MSVNTMALRALVEKTSDADLLYQILLIDSFEL